MFQFNTACNLILEHCKPKALHAVFNILQQKVLLVVYEMLTGDKPTNHDQENQAIMYMILNTDAAKILGDELCMEIPDEKVKNYSDEDVMQWAEYVYSKIDKGVDEEL